MKKSLRIIAYTLLTFSIFWIAYFTDRESSVLLMVLYGTAFVSFLILFLEHPHVLQLLRFSFLLRFLILFALPALSNDFYRFIWDGRMSIHGLNPYTYLPVQVVESGWMNLLGTDAQQLFEGQGTLSPQNYTCYPPVNQFLFIAAAFLFPQNYLMTVVVMRIFTILADVGIVFYGRKILKRLGLPDKNIVLYILNPFIIIEITGNLHFEGIMIFFVILALWHFMQNKWWQAALWFTLSVSIKLIPLIFIPLLLKTLGQRRLVLFTLAVIAGNLILFLPFLSSELLVNFMSSIDLYFRKFEFNASIYYLIRWWGFQVYGWNIIQKVGPLLGLLVFVVVLLMSIVRRNEHFRSLLISMLFAVSIYYMLATTVHPWYLALPLALSIFTRYRFVMVWSFSCVLSYIAYAHADYHENLWLVAVEYAVVYGYLVYELLPERQRLRADFR